MKVTNALQMTLPNTTSAFGSTQKDSSNNGSDFASMLLSPVKNALQSSRQKDQVVHHFMNEKASIGQVAEAVNAARLDLTAAQKICDKTMQAFNDLIYKTSL